MTDRWWAEVARIIGLVLAALMLGWLSGYVLLFLWLATLGYLIYHLVYIQRLEHWLRTGAGPPPRAGSGIWSEGFYQLQRMRQHHWRRKRTITQYLQRFRELTAAMPDATVVMRVGGEIEWFNEAAGRMLGLRSPQDVGQRIGNLVRHPSFAQHLRARRFSEPVEFPSPMHADMTLSVSIVPYGHEQLLLVGRDVTRLHRLERTRRDFVANVSHELRTPLTVIGGFLESLGEWEESLSADARYSMQLMEDQARRMRHIVDDLLLLSRLETNERPPRQTVVAMPALLQTLCAEAKGLSGSKHEIVLEAESDLLLRGAEEELHSAFTNLVSNAVRYTPVGGRITLRWFADARGAYFQVEDTGEGIAPQHIPRLTERFYRVDVGRSRQTGGTGLGLAIVKHVLERHQAQLRVESELGRGSCFSCDFPASLIVRQ